MSSTDRPEEEAEVIDLRTDDDIAFLLLKVNVDQPVLDGVVTVLDVNASVAFHGWLEFMMVLEQLRDRALHDGAEETPPVDQGS